MQVGEVQNGAGDAQPDGHNQTLNTLHGVCSFSAEVITTPVFCPRPSGPKRILGGRRQPGIRGGVAAKPTRSRGLPRGGSLPALSGKPIVIKSLPRFQPSRPGKGDHRPAPVAHLHRKQPVAVGRKAYLRQPCILAARDLFRLKSVQRPRLRCHRNRQSPDYHATGGRGKFAVSRVLGSGMVLRRRRRGSLRKILNPDHQRKAVRQFIKPPFSRRFVHRFPPIQRSQQPAFRRGKWFRGRRGRFDRLPTRVSQGAGRCGPVAGQRLLPQGPGLVAEVEQVGLPRIADGVAGRGRGYRGRRPTRVGSPPTQHLPPETQPGEQDDDREQAVGGPGRDAPCQLCESCAARPRRRAAPRPSSGPRFRAARLP